MVAPDDTHLRLAARPAACARGRCFDRAAARLAHAATDADARVRPRSTQSTPRDVAPTITWGTSPEHAIADRRPHSRPRRRAGRGATRRLGRGARLHGPGGRRRRSPARRSTGSSSAPAPTRACRTCAPPPTSRAAARSPRASPPGWCRARRTSSATPRPKGCTRSSATPASQWREPGCSMCVAANGEQVPPRRALASPPPTATSSAARARGARTHLASPAMAAAAAVTGAHRRRAGSAEHGSPSRTVTGPAAPLLRANIDTDVIIRIERLTGAAARPSWAPSRCEAAALPRRRQRRTPTSSSTSRRFRGAPILLAGRNFGCGSSREAAVWALQGMRHPLRRSRRASATSSSPTASRTACCRSGCSRARSRRWRSECADGARSPWTWSLRPLRAPDGSTAALRRRSHPAPSPAAGLDDIGLTLQDEAAIPPGNGPIAPAGRGPGQRSTDPFPSFFEHQGDTP